MSSDGEKRGILKKTLNGLSWPWLALATLSWVGCFCGPAVWPFIFPLCCAIGMSFA